MTCAPDCTCHCGDGTRPTPHVIDNAPGQPALAARIGSFVSFRRTMLEALASRSEVSQLTTRDSDDASISLIEQGAAVADVLSFYTERYANEAYLGTATFDADVQRIAHLIGYRPAPGISATTTLAVSLESGKAYSIPAGFGVQSVPGPGETPQDFETIEDLAADARFNALPARPQQVFVDPLTNSDGAVICSPAARNLANVLNVGDPVVLAAIGAPGEVAVTKFAAVTVERERLRVVCEALLTTLGGRAFLPRRSLRLFGCDAPESSPPAATPDATAPGGVHWTYGSTTKFAVAGGDTLQLDRLYPDLAVGSQLLVYDSTSVNLVTIRRVDSVRAAITTTDASPVVVQSAPATQVTLWQTLGAFADRRTVSIIEVSSELPLAGIDDDIFDTEVWIPGNAVYLDDGTTAIDVAGPVSAKQSSANVIAPADIASGRRIVLTDAAGRAVPSTVNGEVVLFPDNLAFGDLCHLIVPLTVSDVDLWPFDRQSVQVLGNAVLASHGKTVAHEVLGSGEASSTWQRFDLAKSPLTRVPDASPEGSTPALKVAVDGIPWTHVDEILAAGPRDQEYALNTKPDAKTTIQFGDGDHGVRPSTGPNNIVVRYRYGAGRDGRVRAGTLTNAASRPPGFNSVTNPVPAEGGADPEAPGQTRVRAPRTVRVFGRAVSAQDYADLLISNGTVAKAESRQLWDGNGLIIGVTVAGDEGSNFSAVKLATLAKSDKAAASPYRRAVIGNYVAVPLTVALTVTTDAKYDESQVLSHVRAAVLAAFDFDVVELGRHHALSDLYRATSGIPGVAALNVTKFGFAEPPKASPWEWLDFLQAHGDTGDLTPEWLRLLGIRFSNGNLEHAELPTLADADLTVTAIPAPSVFGGGLE